MARSSRGTRRAGATKTRGRGSPARMHRGKTALKSKVSGGGRGGRHGPSIKKDDTYEALRRKGYSKSKAARIANAQANGTINHRGGGHRKGRPK